MTGDAWDEGGTWWRLLKRAAEARGGAGMSVGMGAGDEVVMRGRLRLRCDLPYLYGLHLRAAHGGSVLASALLFAHRVDILQVGAENMQNSPFRGRVARLGRPVLLVRGRRTRHRPAEADLYARGADAIRSSPRPEEEAGSGTPCVFGGVIRANCASCPRESMGAPAWKRHAGVICGEGLDMQPAGFPRGPGSFHAFSTRSKSLASPRILHFKALSSRNGVFTCVKGCRGTHCVEPGTSLRGRHDPGDPDPGTSSEALWTRTDSFSRPPGGRCPGSRAALPAVILRARRRAAGPEHALTERMNLVILSRHCYKVSLRVSPAAPGCRRSRAPALITKPGAAPDLAVSIRHKR
jgi:hypothetical protein